MMPQPIVSRLDGLQRIIARFLLRDGLGGRILLESNVLVNDYSVASRIRSPTSVK
jgi:hypothetical protein